MSIRFLAQRLIQHGRWAIQHQIFRVRPAARVEFSDIKTVAVKKSGFIAKLKTVFLDGIVKHASTSAAAVLRRRAAMFGNAVPWLSLVGVSLGTGSGFVSPNEELEAICGEIRTVVKKLQYSRQVQQSNATVSNISSVSDMEIGEVIGQGCNAVVYSARWKNDVESNYPFAVKMMFNYEAESWAPLIYKTMYKELTPARNIMIKRDERELFDCNRYLPPHPNIVDMPCVFTDFVPDIVGNIDRYPAALPTRIHPEGSGRNMSLFLVMTRYDYSLKEYLRHFSPSDRTRLMLLTQLLEALYHLSKHEFVHRDLKLDNLLVDLSTGADSPKLVLTDFGCCLDQLSLRFSSREVDRGGNVALMAPEVYNAQPGPFTVIDYSNADVWAAGCLAYEFYSQRNPFYCEERKQVDRMKEVLPDMGSCVPKVVKVLVQCLLSTSPRQRPSVEVAATVCQLVLWAPKSWLQSAPSMNECLQWLMCLITKTICEMRQHGNDLDCQLVSTFLSRVKVATVVEAAQFMYNNTEGASSQDYTPAH